MTLMSILHTNKDIFILKCILFTDSNDCNKYDMHSLENASMNLLVIFFGSFRIKSSIKKSTY